MPELVAAISAVAAVLAALCARSANSRADRANEIAEAANARADEANRIAAEANEIAKGGVRVAHEAEERARAEAGRSRSAQIDLLAPPWGSAMGVKTLERGEDVVVAVRLENVGAVDARGVAAEAWFGERELRKVEQLPSLLRHDPTSPTRPSSATFALPLA